MFPTWLPKGREGYLILPCSATLTYPRMQTHAMCTSYILHGILCILGAAFSYLILYVWKSCDWNASVVSFSSHHPLSICHLQTICVRVCVCVWTRLGKAESAMLLSCHAMCTETNTPLTPIFLSCVFPVDRVVWWQKLPEDEPRKERRQADNLNRKSEKRKEVPREEEKKADNIGAKIFALSSPVGRHLLCLWFCCKHFMTADVSWQNFG